MRLSVAFQMDSMDRVYPETDSSLALALEAQKRGCQNWYYTPKDLVFDNGELRVEARTFIIEDSPRRKCTFAEPQTVSLSEMDILWVRQNPPFNMAYYTNTYLLEHLGNSPFVINNPRAVRNCPEKLMPLGFPKLIPQTIIAENVQEIEDFWRIHKNIILKPIYDYGGNNVFLVREDSLNFNSVVNILEQTYQLPVIAQEFIPAVMSKGDKRILLVDGEPVGCFARMPKPNEVRSNMLVGGTPVASILNKRDLEICMAIGPTLKEQGLLFAGIDVIGDYLTEINVTSPTGINVLNKLDGICVESDIWNAVEKQRTQKL